MSSSMIYCSCSFCGTHQQAKPNLNSLLTTAAPCSTSPLRAKGSTSFMTTTTSDDAFMHKARTGQIMAREASPSKSEQLKFGIEKILCGSSNAECPESQCSHFSDQSGAQLNVPNPTPHRTIKRRLSLPWSRPVFTYHQRMTLESRFQLHHYLNRRERYHLSLYLGLTEHQIKIWFQNRRVKFRHRQTAEKQRTNLSRGRGSAESK